MYLLLQSVPFDNSIVILLLWYSRFCISTPVPGQYLCTDFSDPDGDLYHCVGTEFSREYEGRGSGTPPVYSSAHLDYVTIWSISAFYFR